MNKEQAFAFITEMINCALRRGAYSSVEQQAIQNAYNLYNTPDPVVEEKQVEKPKK